MAAGFGVEIYCADRMRTGRYVSGRLALAQAVYRRLTTPRGTLRDDLSYGIDLPGFVGRVATAIAIAALPGIIHAELLKDDRIADTAAEITAATNSNGLVTLTIEIRVVPVDETEEFTLTLAASSTNVEILGIAA